MSDQKRECVSCQTELKGGLFLRNPGKPRTYSECFYCDNGTCYRYGLLSIYKRASVLETE